MNKKEFKITRDLKFTSENLLKYKKTNEEREKANSEDRAARCIQKFFRNRKIMWSEMRANIDKMKMRMMGENLKDELSTVNVQTGQMLINTNFIGVCKLFEDVFENFTGSSGKVKR